MPTIEDNTQLLIEAAEQGNTDDVRRLIPLSDPKSNDSKALRFAAKYGQKSCVELLIPVSEPQESGALYWAAHNGHADCVALLIPVSNPKYMFSQALQQAILGKSLRCVDLLYPFSDPMVASNHLKKYYAPYYALKPEVLSVLSELEQRIEAERSNAVLQQEIGDTTKVKAQRKM